MARPVSRLRKGPRPQTTVGLPHVQLDQFPDSALIEALVAQCISLPDVRVREPRMASPDSKALCLPLEAARGPAEAFVDDHEFCYLQPLPWGGVHLTLPKPLRDLVVDMGWGELHPGAKAGLLPSTLVLIYAPRDEDEAGVVAAIVHASYCFAAGKW